MKNFFLGIVVFGVFATANATNVIGFVEAIKFGPSSGSYIYLRMEGSVPGKPACSDNQYYDFKFDVSQVGGKETYSGLISAYMAKKQVSIEGTHDCTVNNVEDLSNVVLQ